MSVLVQGTCVEEELAELLMTGGKYPEHGESEYLTWVNSVPLQAGDLVEVTIQDEGETSYAGKTLAELFPEEAESCEEMNFTPTPELFAELRARPRLRQGFRFQLETSRGTTYVGETSEPEHGFGFSVLWNSHVLAGQVCPYTVTQSTAWNIEDQCETTSENMSNLSHPCVSVSMPNGLLVSDTQSQISAARHLLRAGQRQR